MIAFMRATVLFLFLLAPGLAVAGSPAPTPQSSDAAARPGAWSRLRVDVGATVSRFEQQVKAEIGGAKGEVLVTEMALGLDSSALFDIWGPLSAGLFARFDFGERTAGRFAGLDAEGKTVVAGQVGGSFSEFWFGPLVRAQYRALFVDLGYGLVGLRTDDARDDLPSATGNSSAALRVSPTIAWRAAIGGNLPVADGWFVTLSLQYRVRYYVSRGGSDLANNLVHGTQDFTPLIGVSWRPKF